MKEHVERMMKEETELFERIKKLEAFTSSPKFLEMAFWMRELAQCQLNAMLLYYHFLTERIKAEQMTEKVKYDSSH